MSVFFSFCFLFYSFLYNFPVDYLPEIFNVFCSCILCVEVVSMLPDIHGQQGIFTVFQGFSAFGAGQISNLSSSCTNHTQPDPKRAVPAWVNFSLKSSKLPKFFSSRLLNLPRGACAPEWCRASEIKIMIKNLSCIIE